MMVITPGVDLKPLTSGVDYCFVLDVSGSMQSKMGTFKKGVMKAIEKLKPEDRFRLVTFSSNASALTRKWLPASDQNRIKAQKMIDSLQAGGSTNLYAGLSLALSDLDDDRAVNIILVTDAVTNTGVVNPVEFHKLLQTVDIRVFGFLLGNSANWPLMQTIAETTGGFYDSISNTDDIMGKLMLADSKIKYEALLNAEVKISGVNVSEITGDTFKKVYRGQQLVLFGKYEKGGKARVTLKANLTGEDKTYATDFVFPDIDHDNPELERLWALAMIEKIEAQERIGNMPLTEAENAIRDLGLEYQVVTDYTSMVVLSDTAFADRGIERRNQSRIAREQQTRTRKAQKTAKNYTVDRQKPAFKFKAPRLGGGGGAIDPLTGGLAAVLTALGAIRLTIRKKKNH
jgi:Ca-activated chloride channel family protein